MKPATLVAAKNKIHAGLVIDLSKKANGKRIVKFFAERCPQMKDAFEKGELKFVDTPTPFIEFFNKHCK